MAPKYPDGGGMQFNCNRTDIFRRYGATYGIPEGWERIYKGRVEVGDRLFHASGSCADQFMDAGFLSRDLGSGVEYKHCVIRRLPGNTAERGGNR